MTSKVVHKEKLDAENHALTKAFASFYEDNDHFFSEEDKKVAQKYFNGIGENLSLESLLERQRKCVAMCEKSINFAHEQRKEFFALLGSLPISFERKKLLRDQFLSGDFAVKTQVIDFLYQEERRIALKRAAQRMVIEALKQQFVSFFQNHASYFNDFDRDLAITYSFNSIENFRTHASREARLHMLIAMLPANLAYAKDLDEKYQILLNTKITKEQERESKLEKFRSSNFAQKSILLQTLSELTVIEEKKEEIKPVEKLEIVIPKEQPVIEVKATEEPKQKPELKEEIKKAGPTPGMCEIAIRIIKNDQGKKYKDDKEILEDIALQMKQRNVAGNFSEDNLKAMRNILPRLPEQYWGTDIAALWLKKELQGITVFHEYSN